VIKILIVYFNSIRRFEYSGKWHVVGRTIPNVSNVLRLFRNVRSYSSNDKTPLSWRREH